MRTTLALIGLAAPLALGAALASSAPALAWGGCGWGFHPDVYGDCVPNRHPPFRRGYYAPPPPPPGFYGRPFRGYDEAPPPGYYGRPFRGFDGPPPPPPPPFWRY